MRHIWKTTLALLFAGCMLIAVTGCDKNTESSSQGESSAEEQQPVTESNPEDMNYTLTYDSEVIPDELAKTVSTYFYAIETQNYALYLEQLNPLYQETMVEFLQENYGYGLESSLEQYHQTLVDYAGTDNFTVTGLEFLPANEALAENFEEGTDFVADYLETYTTVFGEDFTNQLKSDAKAIYDVAVTMKAKDGDDKEIVVMDNLEMLIIETDDGFGILG